MFRTFRPVRSGFGPKQVTHTPALANESAVSSPFGTDSERSIVRVALISGGYSSLLGLREPLLGGDRGTAQTIRLMRYLVEGALTDPTFIRFAVDLVRNVPAYDQLGEVGAIFAWVQSNIRYTMDPVSKEKLYPPQELLKIRAGDCDDVSMLLGALALALGYPARLVTLSVDPAAPDEFSHVYVEVEVPPGSDQWLPLDAARPDAQFAQQPPGYFRKRAWSLTDDRHEDLRGLSGYTRRRHSLGQDDGGIDYTPLLQQTLTEIPAITAAAEGQATRMTLPGGASVATAGNSPYSSFITPYTPGALAPAAGYSLQSVSSSTFSALLPWLLIGAVVLAVAKR